MKEYIEREAAQKSLIDLPVELDAEAVQRCIETIHNLPAADMREVVLCRDCAYAYPYGLEIKCTKHSGKADRLGEDASYSEFHSLNWFCADAQRKRKKHGEI